MQNSPPLAEGVLSKTPDVRNTAILSLGLALLWSTTFILTVKGVFNGSLLRPHVRSTTN